MEVYQKNSAGYINLSQVLYLQGKIEEAKIFYLKGIELGGIEIPQFEKILGISK